MSEVLNGDDRQCHVDEEFPRDARSDDEEG
jgi:hypothetical protein